MRARPVDDVMESMRQYASQGAAEQQVADISRLGMRRTERTAPVVAFHAGEGNDLGVGEVGSRHGNGFAGQRRRERFHLAASVESHNHRAGKGALPLPSRRQRRLTQSCPRDFVIDEPRARMHAALNTANSRALDTRPGTYGGAANRPRERNARGRVARCDPRLFEWPRCCRPVRDG